jgi:hypothetical protein
VVAILALVAAVGGTAVAQEATTSAVSKKKVKKIAKKQAKKYFDANIGNASVASADTAGTAEGLANVTYIKGPATSIPADGQTHLLDGAICPAGSNVVGGGLIGSFLFRVAQSYATAPNGSDPGTQGWTVRVQNTFGGGGAADGQALAICVEATQTSGTWP